MKSYIEFKQQRELGAILTDTFAFFRNEFKPLFKAIFQIAGPYIALFLVSQVFYVYTIGDSFNFELGSGFPDTNPLVFVSVYLIYLVCAILAYTTTTSAALHYIKSYIKNKGETNILEIKQNVKQTFWSFLGLSFLKGLTIIIAALVCCLPVFYFFVPMAVVLPILVFREMTAGDAYGYGFTLIKDEFWITLATLIVFYIIILVAASIFSVPTAIYSLIKSGVFSGAIDPANMNQMKDPVMILLNVLSSLFQYALNLLVTIGTSFVYFNLNERKNFTGTMERIKAIGNTDQ
ncbi:hypothetical protein [Mangrovimonas sp. YM274]|uniref:hypothetical protein n=1 Tax=Mangrovimonas sp. YM274 TaxID=3070660 RepID=UPI0027DC24E6|nr:hypothetical protein [Mangrovimonas sp. YM274]WMI67703.1 hypothetical protein RBH95_11185 [Mangrovimonas sp. YM274]